MVPKYINNLSVAMSKGGNCDGETQIQFNFVYRDGVMVQNSEGQVPGEGYQIKTEEVCAVVMSRDMAINLRDTLDNIITRSEIDRNKKDFREV